MVTMTDAMALVPPKKVDEPEPEVKDQDVHNRLQLMPLEDLIDYVMVPKEEDRPMIEWTFEGIADHFTRKRAQEVDLAAISRGALEELDLEAEILADAERDAAAGESMLQRIAGWVVKKICKLIVKVIWKGIYRLTRWLIKKVVTNTIKGVIEWIVRPVLMGVLDFVGLNPELWPFVVAAGGLAALGYFFVKKMFGESPDDRSSKAETEEEREDRMAEERLDHTIDGQTIVQQSQSLVPRRPAFSDVGPSGAAYPEPAGAAEIGNAADTSLGGLISRGEGTYTSVNRGAAHGYKAGTEDLPNMTLAEVMAHQQAQDFNAVGRYQIIKPTLAAAAKALHLTGQEKFDKTLQDRIFNEYLVGVKRSAMGRYIAGKSDNLDAAVLAASQEWASVAAPSGARLANGSIGDGTISYYAGTANNKASISAAEMARALQQARAARSNTLQPKATTEVSSDSVKTTASVTTPLPAGTSSVPQTDAHTNQGTSSLTTGMGKTVIVGKNGELIAVNT